MGGSVALELEKRHPEVHAVTYGAPVVSAQRSGDRHRDLLDPVSMFDLGATNEGLMLPHSAGRRETTVLKDLVNVDRPNVVPLAVEGDRFVQPTIARAIMKTW